MYWTEGGPDVTDPNYGKDWSKWSITGNLRNWCRSITAWNIALDEKGTPNIGPFPCGGLVTIDSKTKKVSYSGQYWAMSHFSKFVKRGAKRIDSTGNVPNVSHVAFQNADGKHVAVITNSGDATSVSLKEGDKSVDLALYADSVTGLKPLQSLFQIDFWRLCDCRPQALFKVVYKTGRQLNFLAADFVITFRSRPRKVRMQCSGFAQS